MSLTAEDARNAVAERLSEKGYSHSVSVARTAAELARVYGVDESDAYLAGLLHDWMRESSPDTLLSSARVRGVVVDVVDESVPYLLHARIGVHSLSEVFPDLSEDVLQAVERHTLGAPDMSDLDRIVYVADQIEPGRESPDIEQLRDSIGKMTLAELYLRTYAVSLESLVRDRRRIHPTTVEAWNAIVSEERA